MCSSHMSVWMIGRRQITVRVRKNASAKHNLLIINISRDALIYSAQAAWCRKSARLFSSARVVALLPIDPSVCRRSNPANGGAGNTSTDTLTDDANRSSRRRRGCERPSRICCWVIRKQLRHYAVRMRQRNWLAAICRPMTCWCLRNKSLGTTFCDECIDDA